MKDRYIYKAVLDRVVDGDTFDMRLDVGFETHIFKRLRLLGIDTEELLSPELARRERGHEARIRVEELMNTADKIWVETLMDATGKYGRVLAYVWLDFGEDRIRLDEQLHKEGHAKQEETSE